MDREISYSTSTATFTVKCFLTNTSVEVKTLHLALKYLTNQPIS